MVYRLENDVWGPVSEFAGRDNINTLALSSVRLNSVLSLRHKEIVIKNAARLDQWMESYSLNSMVNFLSAHATLHTLRLKLEKKDISHCMPHVEPLPTPLWFAVESMKKSIPPTSTTCKQAETTRSIQSESPVDSCVLAQMGRLT